MAPFPTAKPLVGLTIWMSARLAGAAGSAGGRSLGHPAGAAVEVVVAGAVVVVLVMPPADLPLEPELQAAPRTRPTTRRIRMRVTTPSWPARPTTVSRGGRRSCRRASGCPSRGARDSVGSHDAEQRRAPSALRLQRRSSPTSGPPPSTNGTWLESPLAGAVSAAARGYRGRVTSPASRYRDAVPSGDDLFGQ